MITTSDGLASGEEYTVRLAGLRNPRVVSTVENWQVHTFDSGAASAAYLIDVGLGGKRPIRTAAPIPTFGVDAQSTVNGAQTSYFITWYSEIAAEVGDKITVPFPAEINFAPTKELAEQAGNRIGCEPTIESLRGIACSFDPVSKDDGYQLGEDGKPD